MLTMIIYWRMIVLFGLVSVCLSVGLYYDDYIEEEAYRSDEYEQDLIRLSQSVTVPFIGLIKAKQRTCTASLLKPNWAITSSSCIHKLRPDEVTIIFAIDSIKDSNGIQVKAIQLFLYPEYNPQGYHNDIALIRFTPSLPSAVQVIPFGIYDWPENLQMICNTAGFNHTNQAFNVNATAARGYKYCLCMNEDRFVCVNQSKTFANNFCTTDIGGPLICENYLFGIRFGLYDKYICNGDKQSLEKVITNCTRSELINQTNTSKNAIKHDINNNETSLSEQIDNEMNITENGIETNTRHVNALSYTPCKHLETTIIYTYINDYVPWMESVMETSEGKLSRKKRPTGMRNFHAYDYQIRVDSEVRNIERSVEGAEESEDVEDWNAWLNPTVLYRTSRLALRVMCI
ncbi:hypothetical protein O3M35_011168 [Rhynocoris fuscipes]|uniref:Peptidase S1 domain-containing protein n=1 Tax=Rhynocoris fuscipes TaxID=488301 RepID=A0AAW1CZS2_9HEMI